MEDFNEAENHLASWLNFGYVLEPDTGQYRHPEFVFRKLGEWPGWNAFLGVSPDHPAFEENEVADLLDEMAWQLYIEEYRAKH
ncbi:hypothetical protein TUM3794_20980 [Shewanella colwelliana]|uniref:Uncharacterized protein n=1 Tax=Shewanella colwelliana TaxID=23 RepID=A0ABQ4P0U9_SHECO|nr:hypothetical protein [Shewanella colwelliana]GIU41133.1 hypothetical protein TUM3794_20980 [Shewanella colwelliana]